MAVSLSMRENLTFDTLPKRIGKAFNVTERWQKELFSHNSVASLTSSRGLRLLLPLPPGTRPNKWQAQATPELEEIFGIFEPFCLLGNALLTFLTPLFDILTPSDGSPKSLSALDNLIGLDWNW